LQKSGGLGKKYDAKPTYKKTKGYFPGIASIGNKIVYIAIILQSKH
jgi:hypothetical protein